MSRPLLLIVDGEPLNRPGLVSAMETDGWMVQWARAAEAEASLGEDLAPDVVVMGPGALEDPAWVERLRGVRPGLPVLALLDEKGKRAPGGGDIQGFLEEALPDGEIVSALRRFRPHRDPFAGGNQLSSEDIFGDLLEELEQRAAAEADASAAPQQAPAALPPAASPSIAPVPPLHAAKPAIEPLKKALMDETVMSSAPREGLASNPPRSEPAAPAPALDTREFTLTGIIGVHDPFGSQAASDAGSRPPSSAAPPVPLPAALPPPDHPLEEYGNYYLLEKIAVGGMAELFRAQQRGMQGFQKIVAIKRILPHLSDNEDFVAMFIDEAKLAAQLSHPNIVQIFDLGKAGSSYYIAMEYVNGRDLRMLLRKAREIGMPFPEGVAAFVTMKVAAALDYAHRKRGFDDHELKLVHRDISPQNVLISQDGAVKLVDFGIAKAATKASHTAAGALKGKLLYMSPEQAMGLPLDNRSDLYSLGIVLFEMLTGERCFQADSELGVLEKVRMGRVQDIHSLNPAVSQEMAGIVHKSLMKNVDHRYPSARFMERHLRELLARQGHIPTEHDVAEYLQALLTGTKEDVLRVMQNRFPQPTIPLRPPPGVFFPPDRDTLVDLHPGPGDSAQLRALPREDARREGPVRRPAWLLPLILAMAATLSAMIWISSHS